MAALLRSLAVSGSRKSDGSVNASGRVWCFTPGTTGSTQVQVYSDADGLYPLTQPVTLDAAGRVFIYTKAPVRLRIEDSTGAVVRDSARGTTTHAAAVEVENAGFTGTVLSGASAGSQGAGGRTLLDTVLTSAYASMGGLDFGLKVASGATRRNAKDVVYERYVSVKEFGAKGDDLADDTTAVAATISYVVGLGGGVVFFPKGTYRVTGELPFVSAHGVTFAGTGHSSILKQMGTGFNLIVYQDANSGIVRDLTLTANTTSSVTCVAFVGAKDVLVSNVKIDKFKYGVDFQDTVTTQTRQSLIVGCHIDANDAASGICVRYGVVANANMYGHSILSSFLSASDLCINIDHGIYGTVIANCLFDNGNNAVKVASTFTGFGVKMFGCQFQSLSGDAINVQATGTVGLHEYGNTAVSGSGGFGVTFLGSNAGDVFGSQRHAPRQGDALVAANNLTLGQDGNSFVVDGNTTINAIIIAGWCTGSQITLQFSGTPTVKHNTAGGAGTARMFLSGSADFGATANDMLTLKLMNNAGGTFWQEMSRTVI